MDEMRNRLTYVEGKENSYDEWLKSVNDNASSDTVNPSWVVTDTYYASVSCNPRGTVLI